ncbi:PREDICTED: NEDD4 family-interacting protein 1-like [Priapulus caudatus]|uniref:NEDD4 family-interacting protein 1-like n=1 Tax=Priapulus caudatus TaxID=37621 RepID=A0ABM1DXD0_PRICU|nr:PREDICTED: NEDD4 family-interacting protein 1-like [Priapulus caudatus]
MDRNPRYVRLPTEEEEAGEGTLLVAQDEHQQQQCDPPPVVLTFFVPPSNIHSTRLTQGQQEETIPAVGDDVQPPPEAMAPPEYDVATTLPSYEDVQKEKEMEALHGPQMDGCQDADLQLGSDALLGTDLMFFFTFMLAFLFNWIGLLFSLCISQTIAGRYGALAGFGLSLIKWTLIVKHSTDLVSGNYWVWWLMMVCGFIIFFRGCTQYLRVKQQWARLTANAREQYIFFY